MNTVANFARHSPWAVLSVVAALLAGCASMAGTGSIQVTLSGSQEVPPVTTAATGSGTITVGADKSVSGNVTTAGLVGVAAHIHDGAPDKNGPVIVPLNKSSDNSWSVPAGARFTDAQFESYKAGNLYINVHTAAHKGGEIRGQLKP